jgi:hypothetical protein
VKCTKKEPLLQLIFSAQERADELPHLSFAVKDAKVPFAENVRFKAQEKLEGGYIVLAAGKKLIVERAVNILSEQNLLPVHFSYQDHGAG